MSGKPSKNGHLSSRRTSTPKVSKLGQRLRELSDKALASGTRTLSPEQIRQRISEIRGS